MNTLSTKCGYLPPLLLLLLLLLLLRLDHCESLTVLLHQADKVITAGNNNCDGPIDIPYEIFNHKTLYVRTAFSIGTDISFIHSFILLIKHRQDKMQSIGYKNSLKVGFHYPSSRAEFSKPVDSCKAQY